MSKPTQEDIEAKVSQVHETVSELVLKIGRLLTQYYYRGVEREAKGAVDYVTEADRISEDEICRVLAEQYPEDGLVAEEGTESESTNGWVWVIDPLDGTTNFSHQIPLYAVSVGLCRQTDQGLVPAYGWIGLPASDELYYGGPDLGAFCHRLNNGWAKTPIAVSQPDSLAECLTVTGFPYNRRDIISALFNNLTKVLTQTQGLRRTGSACYDLTLVARGSIDVYFETGLNSWDIAAGVAIVQGAGGHCSAYSGGPVDLDAGSVLAGSRTMVDALVKLGLE